MVNGRVGTRMGPAPRQGARPSSSTSTQTARSRRVPRDHSCTPREISTPMPLRGMRGRLSWNSLLSSASRPMRLPHLSSSPDLSAGSIPNWRTRAASRSGMGDEPAWANVMRKPLARFNGSCIERSSCTSVRMPRPFAHTPCYVSNATQRHFVPPRPNFCRTETNSTTRTWKFRANDRAQLPAEDTTCGLGPPTCAGLFRDT
jgi:hypothetical protein